MNIVIGVGVFIVTVLLIEGGYLLYRRIANPELRGVQKQLKILSSETYGTEEIINLVRARSLSEVLWLNQWLIKIPLMHKIDLLLQQSNSRGPLGVFLLFSLLLFFIGYLICLQLTSNLLVSVVGGLISGGIPLRYILTKKKRRMEKFQRQLPDALDLVARALKAGHAFSSGMKMITDEFDDPIGTEFSKVLDEINFGVSIPDALKNLSIRVDCPDLKFFVVSVIIQRESGGNLAEILENISHLIRERFKLQGRIRTLSAEGRISAYILIALPFVIASLVYFANPGYIKVLIIDPLGKKLITGAIFLMMVGIVIIRRMIRIRE